MRLESYVRLFLFNRRSNPIQPSSQQYCYRCLDGAEPGLTGSNICVCLRNILGAVLYLPENAHQKIGYIIPHMHLITAQSVIVRNGSNE